MPGDTPLTPKERLEAMRTGQFSKLKGAMKKVKEKEEAKKSEGEPTIVDRIKALLSGDTSLFGAQELKKASGEKQ